MEMKYEIDERVRVKTTGKVGTIQGFKVVGNKYKGRKEVVIAYEVMYDDYKYTDWFKEDQLQLPYEFDHKFEVGLVNLMIDINLGKENLNLQMVKNFADIKQSLVGDKS